MSSVVSVDKRPSSERRPGEARTRAASHRDGPGCPVPRAGDSDQPHGSLSGQPEARGLSGSPEIRDLSGTGRNAPLSCTEYSTGNDAATEIVLAEVTTGAGS